MTDETFLLLAMNNYNNPQCHSLSEFEEDLKKFQYLKKLFLRYQRDRDLNPRLILNHLITISNLFGSSTAVLLFFRVDEECWSPLATFLVYLNLMPEYIPEHGIYLQNIPLDENIVAALENI